MRSNLFWNLPRNSGYDDNTLLFPLNLPSLTCNLQYISGYPLAMLPWSYLAVTDSTKYRDLSLAQHPAYAASITPETPVSIVASIFADVHNRSKLCLVPSKVGSHRSRMNEQHLIAHLCTGRGDDHLLQHEKNSLSSFQFVNALNLLV